MKERSYQRLLLLVLLVLLLEQQAIDAWVLTTVSATQRRARPSTVALQVTAMPLNDTMVIDKPRRTKQERTIKVRNRPKSSQNKDDNAFTRKWDQRFEELREFQKREGHLEPKHPEELRAWVRNQRAYYNYLHQPGKEHLSFLTPSRIERLESLGFVWQVHDKKWINMFSQLEAFKERFGHANVPARWKENPKLAAWVSSQRFRYKARQQNRKVGSSLKEYQIEKLNSLGFSWNPKDEVWWTMYRSLVEYKKKHGHCAVPQDHPALGIWVRHQRRACRELVLSLVIEQKSGGVYVSGLNEERIQALRDIDFCWLPNPDKPMTDNVPHDIFNYQDNVQ